MEGKKQSITSAAEGEASPPAAILARPLSLLRHAAHGCAGYLGGLASRLKPAAAACQPAAAVVTEEEEVVVVVETRSRALPPPRPRGLWEGSGGKHHK